MPNLYKHSGSRAPSVGGSRTANVHRTSRRLRQLTRMLECSCDRAASYALTNADLSWYQVFSWRVVSISALAQESIEQGSLRAPPSIVVWLPSTLSVKCARRWPIVGRFRRSLQKSRRRPPLSSVLRSSWSDPYNTVVPKRAPSCIQHEQECVASTGLGNLQCHGGVQPFIK